MKSVLMHPGAVSLRRARRVRGALPCLALLAAASMASADCLNVPDPQLRAIENIVARDANQALREVQAQLAVAQRNPATPPARLAQLWAIEAQSYSMLELDAEARDAARRGLVLSTAARDPVYLNLLSAYAENVYDQAGLGAATESITAARAAQVPHSQADVCLLITLGRLQSRQGRSDLAIESLTAAYRASSEAALTEPRGLAAGALSSAMREMGDLEQALALNQEVIEWDTARRASLSLSVDHYLRGSILSDKHDFRSAFAEFNAARRLSVELGDTQGIAFADLRVCESQVELKALGPARAHCQSALPVFAAVHSLDMVGEVRALLARIDLAEGRAGPARAALNEVLDHGGQDMPQRGLAAIYRLRARANAALGDYRAAYADLSQYAQRSAAAADAERVRSGMALRARFGADRELERNAALQRELNTARERTALQKVQLHWTVLLALAGILLIALLSYTLFQNQKHRRELLRLATEDGLTGLPNRRRTVELAMQAIAAAERSRRPLTIGLIDLDHFKLINDRCGHAAGDQVLRDFARLHRPSLRAGEVLGRWGGEEFLLILPDTPLDVAYLRVEELRAASLSLTLPDSAQDLHVSVSAGLASAELAGAEAGSRSLDEIVARADVALYEAKKQGRDLVRIAAESMRTASTGVRRALRSN